jgi:ABC-type transporter lipoprotein component MlaA
MNASAPNAVARFLTGSPSPVQMLAKLFDLEDYAGTYRETRNAYLKAANQLKLATGPYKAARDAYVAATATYTKSLYE